MSEQKHSFGDFLKYSISAPKRVGKSYFTIIFYGILLYLIMVILIKIPGIFTQSSYQSGEDVTYQFIKDEGLLAIYSFIVNAKNYLFISIIIFISLESTQKTPVSISDVWQQIKTCSKPLLFLIPITWFSIYGAGLLLDLLTNEGWSTFISQFLIKPLLTMIFLITVVLIKINNHKLSFYINRIIDLVKVIDYKLLISLYVATLALLYNYSGLIYYVRNPLVRKLTEDKTINPMDTLLKINYGFELLAFFISIIIIVIASATAIYAVRATEKLS
ncbi:MAG: hypothetical protein KDF58_06905 [Alphaproteobacteria bacterium]|nr:hypothetical protein [Alphaproteobacteria bacterium]HPF47227.1 hypothetical protein [Emcibacteraceae bacterium]HRW30187.1 hypothetical protein [Emcibacteraceae bacterium]